RCVPMRQPERTTEARYRALARAQPPPPVRVLTRRPLRLLLAPGYGPAHRARPLHQCGSLRARDASTRAATRPGDVSAAFRPGMARLRPQRSAGNGVYAGAPGESAGAFPGADRPSAGGG